MPISSQRINFDGSRGANLSARLDLPQGTIQAYALFAHCFTCSKDLHATKRISAELASRGIAVMRFDFTGLGNSGGDFASTNFSSNKEDLVIAANYLRDNFEAPSIIIAHSLGGAAVLSVAGEIKEIAAVITIGAPSEASHVVHNFGVKLDEISHTGEAEVNLGGRTFLVRKQFLEDLEDSNNNVLEKVKKLKKPLLVMHSPIDNTVGIENATDIFVAAKHPKSFVSLDSADHLVSKDADAKFVANMIATWTSKYIASEKPSEHVGIDEQTIVTETGEGKFQNTVLTNGHILLADEPASVGGLNSGPSPYGYLASALGACTSMTIRMYADFKKLQVGKISVKVSHDKIHAKDCEECTHEERQQTSKIDVFKRVITVEGLANDNLAEKLLEIANKCPVHRTLESGAKVKTFIE